MTIEISKETRALLVASIQRYFAENMEEPIGNLTADSLLAFFVAELGPVVYNQAVSDVQERLQMRVMEVDGEVYEEPFPYWIKRQKAVKS